MKTIKNLFGTKENEKSMNSFFNKLDMNTMLLVKGGTDEGEDEDLWPPKTTEGDD